MYEVLLMVLSIVAVVLLFSLAIFVHEFGHYLAARLLGMKVESFAIGFGPAIWKKKISGIEYRINCIPFGGYVSLPQLDPAGMKKIQGDNSEKDQKADAAAKDCECVEDAPAWKRLIVAAAGPFGNIVLAVLLAFILPLVPGAKFGILSTEVQRVRAGSPAARAVDEAGAPAEIREGDVVVALGDEKVSSWYDLQVATQILGRQGKVPCILKGKDSAVRTVFIDIEKVVEVTCLKKKGSVPPLEKDEFLGVECFTETADGARHVNVLPPEDAVVPVPGTYFLGLISSTNSANGASTWMPDASPWKQLKWDVMSISRILKALVTPKKSRAVASNLGGPVMISKALYNNVRHDVPAAFGFLRFLCINLALLNLLPLPVLDGGHILFALIEMITRRKPPRKFVDWLTNIFAVLLIGVMLYFVYRDSARIYEAESMQYRDVEQ